MYARLFETKCLHIRRFSCVLEGITSCRHFLCYKPIIFKWLADISNALEPLSMPGQIDLYVF